MKRWRWLAGLAAFGLAAGLGASWWIGGELSAVENRIRLRLGPLAPVLSPLLLLQLEPRLGIDADAVHPIRGIGRLGAPVLIAAGSEDRHTRLAESEEMFAAAREPRKLWVVQGAAHQDFLAYDSAGYQREVVSFLTQYLKP